MPNGYEMLNEMEFDRRIKELDDRGLAEFNARQIYDIRTGLQKVKNRVTTLESRDHKTFGIVGGVGGVLGTAVGAAITTIWEKIRSGY